MQHEIIYAPGTVCTGPLLVYTLEVLKEQIEDDLIQIAAYCIMDNHVHIVVEADILNLTKAMKSINIKFAMKINKQKNRIGHVFQDRYKSEVIYNDAHLQQVIRYVHNNPIKDKITKSLNQYKWSSYNEYINKCDIINQKQKNFVLDYFNDNLERFQSFHKEDDDNEYLEIKEDIETQRLDRGQEIISNYFKEHGIYEAKQIIKRPEHMENLIKILLNKSKLSHRKIAELLEISRGDVELNVPELYTDPIEQSYTLKTIEDKMAGVFFHGCYRTNCNASFIIFYVVF